MRIVCSASGWMVSDVYKRQILFILFGIPVVICSLKELIFIWLPSYVLYNQALKVTSGAIRNKRWRNTVDTVIFPYMIIPVLLETCLLYTSRCV